MATTPINICVIGAPGLIGKRHTQHCLDEPTVNLSCIVDPTPAGVTLSEKINVKLYKSLDEMLAARKAGEVKVDGAIVATPNATHVPIGITLVEAGIHALVEKPMSTDIESGKKLVAAAEASGSKLLVGLHRRFNPYIVNTKKILDSGSLGTVLAIQGLWTTRKPDGYFEGATAWRKAEGTGGVILINLVHDMDLLVYMMGPVTRVYCETGISTRGHPVEETGACTLRFASGAVGTFIFSDAATSPYSFEQATGENPDFAQTSQPVYTLLGTKGSMSFPELKEYNYPEKDGCWTDVLQVSEAAPVDPTPPFTVQLRHFAQVCAGKEEPNCSGLEALRGIITLEAVKESMRTGKPVDVTQV